jgi:hypothetical protein
VRSGPPETERDGDLLLLEATLLAHSGQFPWFASVCSKPPDFAIIQMPSLFYD